MKLSAWIEKKLESPEFRNQYISDLKEENERLESKLKAAVDALIEQQRWLGKTGDSIADFDDIAEWFHGATGLMRPGKDQAGYGASDKERHKVFRAWSHKMTLEIRQRTSEALKTIQGKGDGG